MGNNKWLVVGAVAYGVVYTIAIMSDAAGVGSRGSENFLGHLGFNAPFVFIAIAIFTHMVSDKGFHLLALGGFVILMLAVFLLNFYLMRDWPAMG